MMTHGWDMYHSLYVICDCFLTMNILWHSSLGNGIFIKHDLKSQVLDLENLPQRNKLDPR